MTTESEDKALAALSQMMNEFETHKRRLAARAKQVAEALAAGEINDVPALGHVVVELYQELHDTSLSFQQELTGLIQAEWSAPDDDDEDDELDDDADVDEADPNELDEDPSQLLPGDAAQLRRTTTEYKAILDAMLAPENPYDANQRKELQAKLTDAEESLQLIEDIEIRDEGAAALAAPAN